VSNLRGALQALEARHTFANGGLLIAAKAPANAGRKSAPDWGKKTIQKKKAPCRFPPQESFNLKGSGNWGKVVVPLQTQVSRPSQNLTNRW